MLSQAYGERLVIVLPRSSPSSLLCAMCVGGWVCVALHLWLCWWWSVAFCTLCLLSSLHPLISSLQWYCRRNISAAHEKHMKNGMYRNNKNQMETVAVHSHQQSAGQQRPYKRCRPSAWLMRKCGLICDENSSPACAIGSRPLWGRWAHQPASPRVL